MTNPTQCPPNPRPTKAVKRDPYRLGKGATPVKRNALPSSVVAIERQLAIVRATREQEMVTQAVSSMEAEVQRVKDAHARLIKRFKSVQHYCIDMERQLEEAKAQPAPTPTSPEKPTCSVCYEPMDKPLTICGDARHLICGQCAAGMAEACDGDSAPTCPMCRRQPSLSLFDAMPTQRHRDVYSRRRLDPRTLAYICPCCGVNAAVPLTICGDSRHAICSECLEDRTLASERNLVTCPICHGTEASAVQQLLSTQRAWKLYKRRSVR